MKTNPRPKTQFLVAGCLLLVSGCVVRERVAYRNPPVYVNQPEVAGEVVVGEPPPPPVEETITVAPDPAFVWIGGAWVWGGGAWRWEGGHWARPPHPGAVWVPHRYVNRGGRRVWVRGGWR